MDKINEESYHAHKVIKNQKSGNRFDKITIIKEPVLIPVKELTPELSVTQKIHDQQVAKDHILHHLKQLKAQIGKMKSKYKGQMFNENTMDIDIKQINDNIGQWFREFEEYIPVEKKLQYGEWWKFKDEIKKLISEWNSATDRVTDAENDAKEEEMNYNRLSNQVSRLKYYVSNIEWIDNPEHEAVIADIEKRLKNIG